MTTHPRLEYLLVACIAAAITFLMTPLAKNLAVALKAVAKPRDRDVHAVAIPRMGGVAIFAGIAGALFVASRLPALKESFRSGPELGWVVVAAALLCALGMIDDRVELDSVTKLAGQVLACGVMVVFGGVQVAAFPVPGYRGTVILGSDLAIPVTILFAVLTINALNFIDGLDGLAAGVAVITGVAVFAYSYRMSEGLNYQQLAAAPLLLAAILAGACAGFLPHNFFPARIFMGDSGSMVIGMLLSAATTAATTTTDPQAFSSSSVALPLLLPLLIPLAVLALPFVDLALAIVRRVSRGRSPFSPDKQHLHHRLLELGHSHRRAVLLLYFWSAILAFAGVALAYGNREWLVAGAVLVLVVVGVVLSVVPGLRARRRARRTQAARVRVVAK